MSAFRPALAAALALGSISAAAIVATPAAAVTQSSPEAFVSSLTSEGFGAIRSAGGNHAAARTKFRALLAQNFAIDQIGDRLIRRWRPTITPAQYAAYKAALPSFLIGAYADRLFEYSDAQVKVVRAVPSSTGAVVLTQVIRPGAQPITATWELVGHPGDYKVSNMTVAGINLALTQQADFDSFVQRKGFDALVAFMKSRA